MQQIRIPCPRWAKPLRSPARFKGVRSGRGVGKSHAFASLVVERMLVDPNLKVVCLREILKSLKFSVKSLLESKIEQFGLGDQFEILTSEIRRKGGSGICIFQGMQSHNADSIKSLEGFGVAWVEESHRLSQRSLSLLLPTIRTRGSEIWCSWNTEHEDDPIDVLFEQTLKSEPDVIYLKPSLDDNPWVTPELLRQREVDRLSMSHEEFAWVWEGGYRQNSAEQIFVGKWTVEAFEPKPAWGSPLLGNDWGFGTDPTALIQCWDHQRILYIERESYEYRLELDDVPARWQEDIPGCQLKTIYSDNAQPAMISQVRRRGFHGLRACPKWPGSVADGIGVMRSYQRIVIHPRCINTIEEFRRYSYKTDSNGRVTAQIKDEYNHAIDAIRYALNDIILLKRTELIQPTYKSETRSPTLTRERMGIKRGSGGKVDRVRFR